MLEFTRDGASGGPFGRKMKRPCSQISISTEIGGFSVRCFKHLPQVRSSPVHFCRKLRRGIKLNQIYTQYHRRMFPRIANKEIKIDKILQDLPLFTVLLSRALARGFPDVSMERKSIDSFWS